MSPLQRAILLRPGDGVSSGDRVTVPLAVIHMPVTRHVAERRQTVGFKEFIYTSFPKQDRETLDGSRNISPTARIAANAGMAHKK